MSGKQAELSSMVLCLFPSTLFSMAEGDKEGGMVTCKQEIAKVLSRFSSVFEVPTELPPHRTHDHNIPLIDKTPPVNIRPYRLPPSQNDAIEVMVKELL